MKTSLNFNERPEMLSVLFRCRTDEGERIIEDTFKLVDNRFRIETDLSSIGNIKEINMEIAAGPCWIIIDHKDASFAFAMAPAPEAAFYAGKTFFLNSVVSYSIQSRCFDKLGRMIIAGRIEFLNQEHDSFFIEKIIRSREAELARLNEKLRLRELQLKEAAAPAPELGRKAMLKRVVIKTFRKNDVVDIPEKPEYKYTPTASIDVFSHQGTLLHAYGWIFDMFREMEQPRISYYSGSRLEAAHEIELTSRKDVAAALNNPLAINSGFDLYAKVSTNTDLDVYFEYDTPSGRGGQFLGTVKAMEEADEIFVAKASSNPIDIGDINEYESENVILKYQPDGAIYNCVVDVIIPVYNGFKYFDALFSSIRYTDMKYRLIIINDKSPDERVLPYLEKYAAENGNTVLINNEQNMGFVGSVNKGLAMAAEAMHHCVIVNTDVEVPEKWLERIMSPVILNNDIASATPFTTCGTICSFPDFGRDNVLFEDMKLWQIDDAFKTIRPSYPTVPTGVGFCMSMNVNAIKAVGLLDAETFGKGYGEENDWCMRASKAGFRNVHADNLFVYHKHGGSFMTEEKTRLLEKNHDALLAKHPEYDRLVAEFCADDPTKITRLYVKLKLLNSLDRVRTILAFDHSLGGGASEYLYKMQTEALNAGYKFITMRADGYVCSYRYGSYDILFNGDEPDDLFRYMGPVDEIWINELVTYPDLYKMMDKILNMRRENGAYLKMLLHDYFCMCPCIVLLDEKGKYCDIGSGEKCNRCIPLNNEYRAYDTTIEVWREKWNSFLGKCDEITVFSKCAQELLCRTYPDLTNINYLPHDVDPLSKVKKSRKFTTTLNIGILGTMDYKKGYPVITELIDEIEKNNRNIKLVHIGKAMKEIESPAYISTGKYTRNALPSLVLENDVDILFVPSIWPETFSYTTSEAMLMDLPIAVFDIGAPPERVRSYEKGLVIPLDAGPAQILDMFEAFAYEKMSIVKTVENIPKILFVSERKDFTSRYRVEHFVEALAAAGLPADFETLQKPEDDEETKLEKERNQEPEDTEEKELSVSGYRALVIYRCEESPVINKLIDEAKEKNIPVYYDIDDYVYDFEKIEHLTFLKGKEKARFRKMTLSVRKVMQRADKLITSTNTLRDVLKKDFPDKQVLLNRNVASQEMVSISEKAMKQVVKDPGETVIGYFSGSYTHDKDYSYIEKALMRIVQEYPEVYIKIVGVFDDEPASVLVGRLRRVAFVDWRRLPELLASVDINLMPLEDSLFHCCKSENKWTEAALVKVPTIVSRNAEMESVLSDGENTIMCSNEEEWYEAIKKLVSDTEERRRIGGAAYERVHERYTTYYGESEAVKEFMV